MAQHLYEQDNDVPESTSTDYTVRRSIINAGIGYWEGYKDTEWEALKTTLDLDNTGADTTVATGDTQSDCPTSLVKIGKSIRLVSGTSSVIYKRKTSSEADDLIANSSTEKFFWITGKPGAYKINWNPAIPAEYNGFSIKYIFKKKATQMTATTDVPDAPDHLFLVHYLLSWLYKDDDAGKSREQFDISDGLIKNMKRENDVSVMDSREDDMNSGFGV